MDEAPRLALGFALGVNGLGGALSNLRKTSSSDFGLPAMRSKISKESLAAENAVYAAVGRALTSWGRVEDSLGQVLCNTLNPRNPPPIERAYWAIASFDGRLKMADRAIQERLSYHPEKLIQWTDLQLRLQNQNTTRNKLAHGTVILVGATKRNPDGRWVLAPYYHSRRGPELIEKIRKGVPNEKLGTGPKEKLSAKQILQIDHSFFMLQLDLGKFALIVEREACIQEGVPLADDPRHQGILTALIGRSQ